MTIQRLNRRVDALEDANAQSTPGCDVCREWPGLIFYIEEPDGTKAEWNNPWPEDAVTCPTCGRSPNEIVVGVRTDGPQ